MAGTPDGDDDAASEEETRLWLVERTYSDDEQNIIILVYATTDGKRSHRKERAITSFSSGIPDVTAAVTVGEDKIGEVTDEETRERYARAARDMAADHDPRDPV